MKSSYPSGVQATRSVATSPRRSSMPWPTTSSRSESIPSRAGERDPGARPVSAVRIDAPLGVRSEDAAGVRLPSEVSVDARPPRLADLHLNRAHTALADPALELLAHSTVVERREPAAAVDGD